MGVAEFGDKNPQSLASFLSSNRSRDFIFILFSTGRIACGIPSVSSAVLLGASPGPKSPESCKPASTCFLKLSALSLKSENCVRPAGQPF